MDVLLLFLRLLLAVIFGVAGSAKLADLNGAREAVSDFGIPQSLAPMLGLAIPILEIAAAALLLFSTFSWYGAVAVAFLLAAFLTGMIIQMAKGNAPNCHCFGQLHSEPVSYNSLVRNAVFLVPALILVVSGPRSQGLSLPDVNMAVFQLFLVLTGVLLLVSAVFSLRRISDQQTQIMRRIELLELISSDGTQVERNDAGHPQDSLPIGAKVPSFDLVDIGGGSLTNEVLSTFHLPLMFVFVSPTCSPCKALGPRFDQWEREFSGRLKFVFVSSGSPEQNAGEFGTIEDRIVLLQNERELADAFQARWTPTAVFVDAARRIASHPATGDEAIEDLIDRIRHADLESEYVHFADPKAGRPATGATPGQPVPDFRVDSIGGETVATRDLSRKPTLISFWSPDCPHCVRMIDEIKDWDASRGPDDPQFVLFSSADPDKLRALGLMSPVVSDKDFDLSSKLGMFGTPSAVLIDENGRFASEVAVGAANIWALVGRN